ncbi:GNAT family N-acetyltransferase [Yinghuangia aomiensis]
MDTAVDFARAHTDCTWLTLGVHEDNHRARAFYRRLGFTDTGKRVPYPLDPAKALHILGCPDFRAPRGRLSGIRGDEAGTGHQKLGQGAVGRGGETKGAAASVGSLRTFGEGEPTPATRHVSGLVGRGYGSDTPRAACRGGRRAAMGARWEMCRARWPQARRRGAACVQPAQRGGAGRRGAGVLWPAALWPAACRTGCGPASFTFRSAARSAGTPRGVSPRGAATPAQGLRLRRGHRSSPVGRSPVGRGAPAGCSLGRSPDERQEPGRQAVPAAAPPASPADRRRADRGLVPGRPLGTSVA